MKSVRDWLFSQLVSKSVVSSRPLLGGNSFFDEENKGDMDENHNDDDAQATTIAVASHPHSSDSGMNLENQPVLSLEHVSGEDSPQSQRNEAKRDVLMKIEDLQVQFFRVLQRIGQAQNNLLVAKVLYRIHLATLIQIGESDLKRVNLESGKARAKAAEQEAAGMPESNFAFRILVLGKTGVGKSATINSLFDQAKTATDAFQPATDCIQEIVGTINGIKVSIIDTPGFLQSSSSSRNIKRNKKIMFSVKRYIKKSPPDIVLYFERLDLIDKNRSNCLLMKLMTEVFGSAIWFNTILVMTHCSSALPEGPDGYPVSFESYVAHSSELLQQNIHQALSDSKLENPVLLVENHPQCKKNVMGEKVLPNGQVWKSQFLLLCICTKILGDVNTLLKFQNSLELGQLTANRLPSLPHLLSSILRHRGMSSPNGMDYDIEAILLDGNEEDEYDDLPSIRILTKSQFEKLTSSQKKEYLDELDYREILYLKKQLREECRRQREIKLSRNRDLVHNDNNGDLQALQEAVLLPDMAVPPSFDSDCPVHRYRCLVTDDQWIVRPVLDSQGWDHDVGFDGINLEAAMEMNKNVFTSVTGTVSKDKRAFSIQSECAASYIDSSGSSYTLGLDIQSAGTDKIYTIHSNAKLGCIKHNLPDIGVSLTSFKRNYYCGAKLEDTIFIGKRLKFVVNAGRMGGSEQVAYGGSIEATVRGRDFPVRNDRISLTMTVLSFDKEMILGGNVETEFRLSRSMKMSVNANLNTRKMGQVCIKASSCEHLQIALISAFTIFRALLRRKET